MERDEILSAAQKDNKGKDVADLDAQKKGTYAAYFVGFALIIVWDIVEGIALHRINYGGNMAIFGMAFTAFIVKFVCLKKKHELFVALAYGVGFLTFLVLWIMQLAGVIS